MSNELETLLQQAKEQAETYAVVNDEFVIDGETREINVPQSEMLFGVEGDVNIERKYFRCPKIVGDNVDLSKHFIYVAYVYTESQDGSIFPTVGIQTYRCTDIQAEGDDITFSWKLSGNVFQNPGFIAFKVFAKEKEESPTTVFNTTPAFGIVKMTISDGNKEIAEEYPDIINQLFTKMESVEQIATPEVMKGYVDEYLKENPVTGGMTEEERQQLEQNTTDVSDLKSAMPKVDNTLSNTGEAADAKVTGGAINSLSEDIDDLKGNIIKHIPDNSIGSQKINALSDNKPEGNILTDDILEITNLKNNVNVGTQLIYKIPYSEENKGKKVRIKAKRIRFRYQKTDVTEKEVEDLEGVGYVEITLSISTYYGETWVIFDITRDISYIYGLFEDDWVDVDIRKKKIEWIYSDTIDKKLENVCNQHIKDNSSINFETGEINTFKNYTSAVTDFIPTVLGDCFYAYYKKIAIGGYHNQMVVGMYNSDKDYIGKLLQKNNTALDDGWYKFCIPTKECAYVRITFYREKPIVFRCDPEYEFDGDESKISLSYGIEFSKAITAKNQINQAPLKRFEGKKLCVAGDSITEANSTNQNTPWGTIIARQFSMILTNAGKSGSGLFKLGDTGKGLYYRLQSREGEWAEGTDYDYIILCGFMNDGTSKNQYQSINYNGTTTWDALPTGDPGDEIGAQSVYGMLRGCFEFLIQYYPLAKIGFVSSTPRGQITNAVRDTPEGVDKTHCHGHAWFEEYIKAYKYVCEEYNIPFLDIYHNSPFRVNTPENYKLYFTNWESEISTYGGVVHPNALGQEIAIANPIFQWMKTYL